MHTDVEAKIIKAIEEQIDRDAIGSMDVITVLPKITSETHVSALPIDSLGLIELMAGIEDHYDIIVPHCDCTFAETVGDIIETVRVKVEAALPQMA